MSDLTREQTIAFHAHMAAAFEATLRDKRTAPEMVLAAQAQVLYSRISAADYATKFATTVGHDIYLPYDIGVPDKIWNSNWGQAEVVTHECRHVVQTDERGIIPLAVEGLHTTGQAQIELEARITTLELHWWRYGQLYPTDVLANDLVAYGCGPRDVEFVKLGLDQAGETVTRGGIITRPGQAAIAWLAEHAAELVER